MKISDPLGKVYTHTMFKKKSYELRSGDSEDEDEEAGIHTISADHHRSMEPSEDEEDDISDDMDDSLSTKSSRIMRRQSSRRRESSRARTVVRQIS